MSYSEVWVPFYLPYVPLFSIYDIFVLNISLHKYLMHELAL